MNGDKNNNINNIINKNIIRNNISNKAINFFCRKKLKTFSQYTIIEFLSTKILKSQVLKIKNRNLHSKINLLKNSNKSLFTDKSEIINEIFDVQPYQISVNSDNNPVYIYDKSFSLLTYSPCGEYLAATTNELLVNLYTFNPTNLKTFGNVIAKLKQICPIIAISYSPDGNYLAILNRISIAIFDVNPISINFGKEKLEFKLEVVINDLNYLPNNGQFLLTTYAIYKIDFLANKLVTKCQFYNNDNINSNKNYLQTAVYSDLITKRNICGLVRTIDLQIFEFNEVKMKVVLILKLGLASKIDHFKFNPYDDSFAIIYKHRSGIVNEKITTFNLSIYSKEYSINEELNYNYKYEFNYVLYTDHKSISQLTYSPCGNYIAFACTDTFTVKIYSIDKLNTSTFKTQVAKLTGHNNIINSIRFSPSGFFIVTGSKDQFMLVYA